MTGSHRNVTITAKRAKELLATDQAGVKMLEELMGATEPPKPSPKVEAGQNLQPRRIVQIAGNESGVYALTAAGDLWEGDWRYQGTGPARWEWRRLPPIPTDPG